VIAAGIPALLIYEGMSALVSFLAYWGLAFIPPVRIPPYSLSLPTTPSPS